VRENHAGVVVVEEVKTVKKVSKTEAREPLIGKALEGYMTDLRVQAANS
jgi:hypothetical protein